jgi:hypothetical protein
MTDQAFYWCLRHQRVEPAGQCRSEDRLGPYATEAEARQWRERHEGRETRWEEEDERWESWGEEDEDRPGEQ